MTPVEHTRTWSARHPSRSATSVAVAAVSRSPRAPVQALAEPELRTTARGPEAAASCEGAGGTAASS